MRLTFAATRHRRLSTVRGFLAGARVCRHDRGMRSSFLSGWRVARTALVSLAALVFVLLAILALRPSPDGGPVWVTTAGVEYGRELTEQNVELMVLPERATSEAALPAEASPVGSVADRQLPARTVLTESDLQGTEETRQLSGDETLLDVVLPAHAAGIFQAGEVVDLWGQVEDCGDGLCPPEQLAKNCRIVRTRKSEGAAWAGEESVALSVALPERATGPVLLAQHNGSLQAVLRGVAPG